MLPLRLLDQACADTLAETLLNVSPLHYLWQWHCCATTNCCPQMDRLKHFFTWRRNNQVELAEYASTKHRIDVQDI